MIVVGERVRKLVPESDSIAVPAGSFLQANIASKLEAARSTSLCCLRAQTALAGWRRPQADLGVCRGFREAGIIGYDAREFIAHGESRCEVDCGKRPQADGLQSGSVVQKWESLRE